MPLNDARLLVGFAVVLVCASMPIPSRPNGMPSEPEPVALQSGGLVPLENTDISLVREELVIKAYANPLAGFSARAVYTLRNPGPARRIAFGVPAIWPMTMGAGWEIYDALTAEAFERVQIRIAGNRVKCEKRAYKEQLRDSFAGWCAASMEIPHGDAILLELEYPLENVPVLVYPLWPAGYWKGPVERLSIHVELGASAASAMVASPPGGSMGADGVLTWEFEKVDLKQLGSIQIRFAPNQTKYGGWIRAAVNLSATASSSLPREGRTVFGPERAVDGDDKTAWCEGVARDGREGWLRVVLSVPERPGWECKIIDFTVVPGNSRDEASYLANGRVTRARIESCAEPKNGLDVSLMGKDEFNANADRNVKTQWLPGKRGSLPVWIGLPPDALGGERECVRLAIREVQPGAGFHGACISEFTPRLYCKKKGPLDAAGTIGAKGPVASDPQQK